MPRPYHISFTAKLTEKLIIEVSGKYYPAYNGGWEDPPEPAEFEYQKVEFIVGDVVKLLDYIDDHLPNTQTIAEWMEELCEKFYEPEN